MPDLSVELSGVEEGDKVTQGSLLTLQCSVERLPGLSSVDWWSNTTDLLQSATLTTTGENSRQTGHLEVR